MLEKAEQLVGLDEFEADQVVQKGGLAGYQVGLVECKVVLGYHKVA